ncbi:MAG: hypothetical protein ACRCXX_14120 [Cetobacterium sp.]|uniref:hypothetical protein n=1 Tax=Cetobacterium sp. TaxID=2071632 RepID=UPI003F30624B
MSKKRRIITDDLDLEDKQGKTADSFYGPEGKGRTSDAAPGKAYSGKKRFFAVLSTSDKAINNRLYDKESWKKTVTDGTWNGPIYAKPMLRNHDLYSDTPFGRIKDSFFVDHDNTTVVNKDNKALDEKVLNHFKDLGVFNEGTGTVIVEFSSDEATAQRMIAGLDCTVSQSSFFGKASCTICGNDYFGGECTHIAGKNYPKKDDKGNTVEDRYCLVKAQDFEPIELSIVNIPANDTSVIYVLDENTTPAPVPVQEPEGDNKNAEQVPGIDEGKNTCNDSGNDKNTKTEDNAIMKALLKDTLKEKIKKEISDSPEFTENFDKVFDSLTTDEDIKAMKAFLDSIATVIEAKVEDAKKLIGEAQIPVGNDGNAPAEVNPEGKPEDKGEDTEGTTEQIKDQTEAILGDSSSIEKEVKPNLDKKIMVQIQGLKL